MFAAKVCAHVQCDILAAEMTLMNCLNNVRTFQAKELEEERYLLSGVLILKVLKNKYSVKMELLEWKNKKINK